ncbi:MAG: hypothetical protein A2233_00355 [Candidatus Kerfeldbacteria bacterium RIFOXYA2_FULL_38_24]|uniref:Glycosyl transferase family 1 domain-containing protein n=1 Tax=Candidatus Kerfeldbacteria bacterium RIFOXYB2_FULL_38_14 TaxID=1798547 RepID=A0A1G2BCX9_9BACT|nr:MAG: hypothetical protein A2233_00355 [Candidatus Kerfeldbacteria bacterium RIFOXYA2_FULL_38_24]OGY86047.1 MAG: hypothetical protein A2319_00560 [Candidatus Kerfeldbacteria bacterium RIFOXYB2_FULL_38_14]OGY90163.1 MAG: hypothetical protein A2458_04815 [Candidatus Kerfeldbacteria bacterium RIFOXYC2_FULL_38_9]
MNKEKTLIMLNMSYRRDWQAGLVNRNYHILQHLIASNYYQQIVVVDFLPFSKKKKLKVFLQNKPWKKNKNTVAHGLFTRLDQDEDKKNVYYATLTNPRHLKKALKHLTLAPDITLWSYTPFFTDILDQFPQAKIIFDAVDNWCHHPAYAAYQKKLTVCYELIKKKADIIFTVSESLVDFFGKKDNVFYIPNGVDVEHFSHLTSTVHFAHELFNQKNSPSQKIIGYHGIIQFRLNLSIFGYLAEKHPDWHLVIIGPNKISGWEFFTRNKHWKNIQNETKNLAKKFSNIHFLGGVPYESLPNYLKCFDVAIIPHRVDALTQSMNPLKIYEYLAVGKPIVASAVPGADQFQDLIKLAVSPEDFSQKIEKALSEDNEELKQRRINMARQHSWENRIALMLDIIKK